jgi:hypothetical protein
MSLFSDLIASGRIRDREQLRRVYRRVVKRLHPDSAPRKAGEISGEAAETGGGFVDFDDLRRELDEAERLLAELSKPPETPVAVEAAPPRPATRRAPSPRASPGATRHAERETFDRRVLIAELRDLVARGLPVNVRAATRNRAYRDCVAKVSAQLALLSGDPERFALVDKEMRRVKYGSLRLHYYVMQVLWNGLDWALMGYDASRDTALRDFGVIRDNLEEQGLLTLEALLAWIIEADKPFSRAARTAGSKR